MSKDKPSLHGIKNVLLKARNETDYNIGSPAALDHLLVHVVYAIEAFEAELLLQKQSQTRLAQQVARYLSDEL